MVFELNALNPVMIATLAVNLVALAVVAIALVKRHRREQLDKQRTLAVTDAVIQYFQRSGVGVAAGCVQLGANRLTVFVESEPMKRFRLSHIIEATVREYVEKICDVEIDKIYWRFPISQNPVAIVEGEKPVETPDAYINEGLVPYHHLPTVEVTELSWENFEAASQRDEPSLGAAGEAH